MNRSGLYSVTRLLNNILNIIALIALTALINRATLPSLSLLSCWRLRLLASSTSCCSEYITSTCEYIYIIHKEDGRIRDGRLLVQCVCGCACERERELDWWQKTCMYAAQNKSQIFRVGIWGVNQGVCVRIYSSNETFRGARSHIKHTSIHEHIIQCMMMSRLYTNNDGLETI